MEVPGPGPQVSFVPTYEDALAAYRLSSRPKRGQLLLGGGLVLCCGAASVFMADLPAEALVATMPGALALYAVFILLIRGIMLPRRVRKIHRQQASLRREFRLSWDDACLHTSSALSAASVPWGDYVKRRENAEVILLYHSDVLFQFIPRRVLTAAQAASIGEHLSHIPLRAGKLPRV